MSADDSEPTNMWQAALRVMEKFGAITVFCGVLLFCIFAPGGLISFMQQTLVGQLQEINSALVSLEASVQESNELDREMIREVRNLQRIK